MGARAATSAPPRSAARRPRYARGAGGLLVSAGRPQLDAERRPIKEDGDQWDAEPAQVGHDVMARNDRSKTGYLRDERDIDPGKADEAGRKVGPLDLENGRQ